MEKYNMVCQFNVTKMIARDYEEKSVNKIFYDNDR